MIISRTPFRVSFFGGGTDYPAWYRAHGGGTTGEVIRADRPVEVDLCLWKADAVTFHVSDASEADSEYQARAGVVRPRVR